MSQPSKTNANLKYYGGAAKETFGKVIGGKQIEAEGKAKKIEGGMEYEAAKMTGKAQGIKDEAAGKVKQTTGGALGDTGMRVEGKATELKGQAQRQMND